MAGRTTAILMQNSGLGNSVNVLASLYSLYISHNHDCKSQGHRGGVHGAQVPMGRATEDILRILEIPFITPRSPDEARKSIVEFTETSIRMGKPVAVLLDVSYW